MPSQFFGLNIAYTGLQASNAWLTTTANNIANVETEGYSTGYRQTDHHTVCRELGLRWSVDSGD